MILLIDNYDSFVHNLARYLRRLGQETRVIRNDKITLGEVKRMGPDAIVLSPGPCAPQQAGVSLELAKELYREIPLLGICLGHQVIAEALGGSVRRANEPVHGRASAVVHRGQGLFAGLPSPLTVGRYHSLIVADLPSYLQVDAWLADGTPMAISHRELPVHGLQFHPESILTERGYDLLVAFLERTGKSVDSESVNSGENARESAILQADWFQKAIEYPTK